MALPTLIEYNDGNNVRTYSLSGHLPNKPRLVIQKRVVPSSLNGVDSMSIKTVYGTEDAEGLILLSKFTAETIIRLPRDGLAADQALLLAAHGDIVASAEYAASVASFNYIQ